MTPAFLANERHIFSATALTVLVILAAGGYITARELLSLDCQHRSNALIEEGKGAYLRHDFSEALNDWHRALDEGSRMIPRRYKRNLICTRAVALIHLAQKRIGPVSQQQLHMQSLELYGRLLAIRKGTRSCRTPADMANAKTADDMATNEACMLLEKNVANELKNHESTGLNAGIAVKDLADAEARAGRYINAVLLYEYSLKIFTIKLGKDHSDTVQTTVDLAKSYVALKRYSDAEPLFLSAIRRRTISLGWHAYDTATCIDLLSNMYCAQGRYSEAQRLVPALR